MANCFRRLSVPGFGGFKDCDEIWIMQSAICNLKSKMTLWPTALEDCLYLDLGDLKIVRKSGKCNLQSAIRNLQSKI